MIRRGSGTSHETNEGLSRIESALQICGGGVRPPSTWPCVPGLLVGLEVRAHRALDQCACRGAGRGRGRACRVGLWPLQTTVSRVFCEFPRRFHERRRPHE